MTPQLVKPAVAKGLNEILAPIQAEFQASKEWQDITEKAYPPPPPPAKKKKEKKDKGTMHPGNKNKPQKQDAQPDGVKAEAGGEQPQPDGAAELPVR